MMFSVRRELILRLIKLKLILLEESSLRLLQRWEVIVNISKSIYSKIEINLRWLIK